MPRPRGRTAGVVVLECSATTARLKSERRKAATSMREREREHAGQREDGPPPGLDPRAAGRVRTP